MFIYTGEIERNIDPTRFAISALDSPPKYTSACNSKGDVPRWHPLDSDSAWNLKQASWEDLLYAADLYKIDELKSYCQNRLIEPIDDIKAIETLIHVGPQFLEVKERVLSYIAKNMKATFAGGNDPFEPIIQHPRCHKLLVEVILRSHNMGL